MTIKDILLRIEDLNTDICIDLKGHKGSEDFTIYGEINTLSYRRIKQIEDKQVIEIRTFKKINGTPVLNILYED